MKNADVLIIGAGAAGLMAAYTLTRAGKKVTVLEACNRTGGRIHTLSNTVFFNHAELGAEFVHGNLPITLQLLEEASIPYHPAGGEMWQSSNGTFTKDAGMMEGWPLLMKKLNALEKDITLDAFLNLYFTDAKFDGLKESVQKYAAGYDTGDPALMSAFSLRNEWQNEDEDAQHRIQGGYCTLINYLANVVKNSGNSIFLNAPVANIEWTAGHVKATVADGESYEATKAIMAIPLGVWQAPKTAKGVITFKPAIKPQEQALGNMGFGAIIKILLQFNKAFWEDEVTEELAGHSLKNMGFLFTEEAIPTWWTQAPQHIPLLTGWLGGPAAKDWAGKPAEEILQYSLQTLSNIFNRSTDWLKKHLVASHVANWTADPYIYGSYAYDTVHTAESLNLLRQSVEDTLFFAGEYMYQGPAMGTVEAALTSGKEVGERLIGS